MVERYLIDTNTLIDAQSGRLPQNGLSFVGGIVNSDFVVSFVSYIEFLGYSGVTDAMNEFIGFANVIEIDKTIINKTIEIRQSKRIKLPDAIIAATALVLNFTVVSRNTTDFENIAGLKVIDPWEF